ncbi:MAG: RNA polymerase sigma factor [Calditrichaceae bacterium]
MNDSELIQLIVKKDRSALRHFVEQYQSLVINTAFHIIGNKNDAEDVAQEVFLQIYNSAATFEKKSKLSTWIYRITVNRSLNFLRDNRKFSLLRSLDEFIEGDVKGFPDQHAPLPETPDRILESKETGQIIKNLLKSLPENQRVAWVLHQYNDLPYQEIVKIMDLSLSSVESLIFRARKNLQKKLLNHIK